SHFEERSVAGTGEHGRPQTRDQCGVRQNAGQCAVAAGDSSPTLLRSENRFRRDGRRTVAQQPEGGTGQADLERISISVSRTEGVAGGDPRPLMPTQNLCSPGTTDSVGSGAVHFFL